jgi:hypothetical protein
MSEVITRFLNRPTLNQLNPAPLQKMVFLIDAAQATAAWRALTHARIACKYEQLWGRTPFQAHMLQGPTWFVIGPQGINQMADLCHQRPGGIALTCTEPKAALAHARALLSEGSRNIHDPAIWASMALESGRQQACLFGPWCEVFTPVPSADPTTRQWHAWKNDAPATAHCEYPLSLPDSLYSTYIDIRWLYWLRHNPQPFTQLSDTDLPRSVSNLNFLVKHGIGVDRHLLQLSALIIHGDLSQREDLMAILMSRELPHRRVEQLLQRIQP